MILCEYQLPCSIKPLFSTPPPLHQTVEKMMKFWNFNEIYKENILKLEIKIWGRLCGGNLMMAIITMINQIFVNNRCSFSLKYGKTINFSNFMKIFEKIFWSWKWSLTSSPSTEIREDLPIRWSALRVPGGNQVDGLPPARHTDAVAFARTYLPVAGRRIRGDFTSFAPSTQVKDSFRVLWLDWTL